MERRDVTIIVSIGVLLNSALYLAACFVAGIITMHPLAWPLAIAAMGFTYLCYLTQSIAIGSGIPLRHTIRAMLIISILLGLAAGLALL